jgi:hypothetical protein
LLQLLAESGNSFRRPKVWKAAGHCGNNRFMDWPEVVYLLDRIAIEQNLKDRPLPQIPSAADDPVGGLRRHHEQHWLALDQAVEEFAQTGRWRELSADEAFWLRWRVHTACRLVDGLSVCHPERIIVPPPNPEASRRQVLEWLLIYYWRAIGFRTWMDHWIVSSALPSNRPSSSSS